MDTTARVVVAVGVGVVVVVDVGVVVVRIIDEGEHVACVFHVAGGSVTIGFVQGVPSVLIVVVVRVDVALGHTVTGVGLHGGIK